MTLDAIDRVAVLGAGNMGHGITEVVALAGYDVTMRDIKEEFVEDGYEDIEWSLEKLAEKGRIDEAPAEILDRIDTTTDLEEATEDADLVIEAAPEEMDIKHDIFSDLDEMTHDDAILASNTSSLPITEIAEATDRPERVVGMHFFNPPVKMDLVEVIYGQETSDETAETTYEFVESIDKTPIYVRKDVRGFVVNSVLGPFGDEAGWMVSNDEATIRETDATMVHERGYPMGPFELGDLTGIDIGYHVRKEAGQPVPPIVEEKVEAEELGQKTGKGYYDYEDGDGA
ncbi:3-hydroxyacyl-CoA dehydrogenase family protein, partial [Natronomonas sp.]